MLGVIPYTPSLSMPTIQHIIEETDIKMVSKTTGTQNKIRNILIGAMSPHDALDYIEDGSLLITPGDREDLIMTALSMHLLGKQHKQNSISGIILTGGIMPHPKIMSLIENASIPVLFSREHTYITASKIHDLAIKIRPEDKEKTMIVKRLIKKHVDVNKILEKIKQDPSSRDASK